VVLGGRRRGAAREEPAADSGGGGPGERDAHPRRDRHPRRARQHEPDRPGPPLPREGGPSRRKALGQGGADPGARPPSSSPSPSSSLVRRRLVRLQSHAQVLGGVVLLAVVRRRGRRRRRAIVQQDRGFLRGHGHVELYLAMRKRQSLLASKGASVVCRERATCKWKRTTRRQEGRGGGDGEAELYDVCQSLSCDNVDCEGGRR
jgi:hypothetical protein